MPSWASTPADHWPERAHAPKRAPGLQPESELAVGVVHAYARPAQRATAPEPARQLGRSVVAGAGGGGRDAGVDVAVRVRERQARNRELRLAVLPRARELARERRFVELRQARVRPRVRANLPPGTRERRDVLPRHPDELLLVRPAEPLVDSRPGHGLAAVDVLRRHEHCRRRTELGQQRERELEDRAEGVIERDRKRPRRGRGGDRRTKGRGYVAAPQQQLD